MRPYFLINFPAGFLFAAVLLPIQGIAQVFYQPTPPPLVTAASEAWQLNGEPVFSDGFFYYPSGPDVFFDGNAMARTGVYRGIPLYQDRTLEPYSIVYVPVGGTTMRPYERRREGELAGTTGSRTPSWPVQTASPTSSPGGNPYFPSPAGAGPPSMSVAEPPRAFDTAPATGTADVPAQASGTSGASGTSHVSILSLVPPHPAGAMEGVWIQYDGARWYNVGPAVTFDPERFVPSGEYHGFTVYRARNGGDEIYVPAVRDGGLTPYAQR